MTEPNFRLVRRTRIGYSTREISRKILECIDTYPNNFKRSRSLMCIIVYKSIRSSYSGVAKNLSKEGLTRYNTKNHTLVLMSYAIYQTCIQVVIYPNLPKIVFNFRIIFILLDKNNIQILFKYYFHKIPYTKNVVFMSERKSLNIVFMDGWSDRHSVRSSFNCISSKGETPFNFIPYLSIDFIDYDMHYAPVLRSIKFRLWFTNS